MHQKSLLVVVVALLLAVAGACWFLPGDSLVPGQVVGDEAASGSTPATAVTATGDQERGQPADASAPKADDEVRAAAAAPTGARPLPDDANWVTITVVDKVTSQPVTGAKVLWSDETLHEYLGFEEGRWDDWDESTQIGFREPETTALKGGWSTMTDDKGQARVTLRDHTTVIGRHESRYGLLLLRKNTVTPPGGYKLLLDADKVLQVKAVTADGQPAANVPIGVVPFRRNGEVFGWFAWNAYALTDAEGRATVSHVQALQEESKQVDGFADEQLTWRVRATLPGNDDPGVEFAIDSPPSEPVVLRLPPCGTIKVRAQFGGKPLAGFRTAFLAEFAGEDREPKFATHRVRRADDEGTVTFPHVPTGKQFYAGNYQLGLNRQFPGPVAAGQDVEIVLEPGKQVTIWRGRLLLPDGTPASTMSGTFEFSGPGLGAEESLRTDSEGRFQVATNASGDEEPSAEPNAAPNRNLDKIVVTVRPKNAPPLQAKPPARTLRPGIEELGDLKLDTGSVIVGGRLVVGEEPFRRRVHLRVQREQAAEGRRQARWNDLGELTQWADHRQGVFTIYGDMPPGRYRLQVWCGEALPIEPIEFQLGTKDLVVAVDTGTPLAASLLLPEKAPTDQVQAKLVPTKPPVEPQPAPAGEGRNRRKLELTTTPQPQSGERHDLQWPAVPNGSYTLELTLPTRKEPIFTIPDVVVPPPEGGDPRLVDIDLRGALRKATIHMFDAEGKPTEQDMGVVFAFGLPEQSEWQGQIFHDNKVELLLPTGPADLLVAMRGYRPQRIACLGERVDVRLDPWPTIELLASGLQVPPGMQLQARLTPVADGNANAGKYRAQWNSGNRSDLMQPQTWWQEFENGRVKLPIGDGPFRLQLMLRGNDHGQQLADVQPAQVLSTAGQVAVQVSDAAWKKAIAEIEKRKSKQ